MRDTLELMALRATCRSYQDTPIPEDTLHRLLTAACSAPSAGGFENRCVIVVQDEKKRAALSRLSRGQGFIKKAPVSLVFCIDLCREQRLTGLKKAPFPRAIPVNWLLMNQTDAAIAAQSACIAAEALGLASCYNGNVIDHAAELCRLLALPKYVLPVIMLTVGYPKNAGKVSKKYPVELLAHRDTYSQPADAELLSAYHKKTAGERYKLTPERLAQLYDTAKQYGGEEYAEDIASDARKTGALNPYQYWLGCYYPSGEPAISAAEYAKLLAQQGFDTAT